MRDPRAAIAGFYRGVQRKCGSDLRCYRYRSAEHLSGWRYAVRLWKENNVKIVKNELLVQDLKREMTDISDWMGLKYNSILTVSTSSNGTAWKTDSCYISRDDPEVEKNIFFSPENVKKRWMGVLSKKEITIIESIFSDVFSEFDYDRIVEKKILNSISGYLYFIFPNKIWRNYFRNNSFLKALHLYFSDVYTHIFVLYGDGSKKYD